MSPFRRHRRRFRLPLRSSADAREAVDEELAFHLEMAVREKLEAGMDPEAARKAVLREFGDLERTRVYCADATTRRRREVALTMMLEQIIQDARYGARTLLRSPGFTCIVVITLGLGIAANTIVFSLLNPFFLRPLPFGEPDELVQVHQIDAVDGWDQDRHSLAQFEDWTARSRSLAEAAVYQYTDVNLTGREGLERAMMARMSGNMFEVLRIEAALGRTFGPDEAGPGGSDVALLDHGLWQRRYAGDAGVLGGTIQLDGVPHTVIGVMPPEFTFPFGEVKVWTPVRTSAAGEARARNNYIVVARLADGWTLPRARDELAAIQRDLALRFPESDAGFAGVNVLPLRQALNFMWDPLRTGFMVTVVAMGFVLLLACVNVASLTLGRITARSREVAVRAAVGAGRKRLVSQFLTEGTLLAVAGGLVGLGLSWATARAVGPLLPEGLYRVGEVSLDGRVLVFTAGVTLLTPFLFALTPALTVSRGDLTSALKEGGRGDGGGPRGLLGRRILVVAQVALGLVLITGAGLMIRSFDKARKIDLGYDATRILSVEATLPASAYAEPDEIAAFFDRAVDQTRALPGVREAAAVYPLPLNHETLTTQFAPGDGAPPREEWPVAEWFRVSDDYFEAMGIQLVAGRAFQARDAGDVPPTVVVSRTLARRWWEGESPVGKTLLYGSDDPVSATVVGVVEDVVHGDLTGGTWPQLYLPLSNSGLRRRFLVARVDGDPGAFAGPARGVFAALDPNLPVNVRPLEAVVLESTLLWAGPSAILAAFGLVALLLAALGLYGVISYWVTRRRREMGIRLALGAEAREVGVTVLKEGLRLTAVGIGAGLLLALLAGRAMASVLFGVSPVDPVTLGAVTLLFVLVSALASLVPALRASRVSPLTVLRAE